MVVLDISMGKWLKVVKTICMANFSDFVLYFFLKVLVNFVAFLFNVQLCITFCRSVNKTSQIWTDVFWLYNKMWKTRDYCKALVELLRCNLSICEYTNLFVGKITDAVIQNRLHRKHVQKQKIHGHVRDCICWVYYERSASQGKHEQLS